MSSITEVALGSGDSSRIHQLVCSPFRNPLPRRERRVVRIAGSRPCARLFGWLARRAGVDTPSAEWHQIRKVTYENSIGEILLEGRRATAVIRRSPREGENPEQLVADHPIELTSGRHR